MGDPVKRSAPDGMEYLSHRGCLLGRYHPTMHSSEEIVPQGEDIIVEAR